MSLGFSITTYNTSEWLVVLPVEQEIYRPTSSDECIWRMTCHEFLRELFSVYILMQGVFFQAKTSIVLMSWRRWRHRERLNKVQQQNTNQDSITFFPFSRLTSFTVLFFQSMQFVMNLLQFSWRWEWWPLPSSFFILLYHVLLFFFNRSGESPLRVFTVFVKEAFCDSGQSLKGSKTGQQIDNKKRCKIKTLDRGCSCTTRMMFAEGLLLSRDIAKTSKLLVLK